MSIQGFGSQHAMAAVDLHLIPYPQQVSFRGAPMRPLPSMFLHLPAETTASVRRRVQIVADQLTKCGYRTNLNASTQLKGYQALLSTAPQVTKHWEQLGRPLRGMAVNPEGYRLTVTSEGALIQGQDERGLYYGGQTLRQLLEDGLEVPGLEIEDGPLLPYRAVHWDMRGWPPSRDYFRETIDKLAGYKVNTLVLEYERHFSFNSQHGLPSREALPPNFLSEMDLYAKDRGVQLVPLQHCIGNLNYMLKLDPYKDLREDPRFLQMACPSNAATLDIFVAMAEDLMAVHAGDLFHAGGDQARFLGVCDTCKGRAKQMGGRASLYLEYLSRVSRYLKQRNRATLVWDDLFRNMTDAQVQWLPVDVVQCFWNYSGQGGRATPAILTPLERYKELGRRVWGCASRLPFNKYECFDNIDAWAEAAEMGYTEGMMITTWTREFALGPLQPPPEIAWAGAVYGAERMWGGRKNAKREEIMHRFGANFFGVVEKDRSQTAWAVVDLLVRDYPREAREMAHRVYKHCKRNREVLEFADAWCRVGAFRYYQQLFEQMVASDYGRLQAGQGDPFHAGRLHWRIEDLKARVAELNRAFRQAAARITTQEAVEEYLNGNLAYGVERLDALAALLEGYPTPEKEWQQPVKV